MKEKPGQSNRYRVEDICFGLDRYTDERSLGIFLKKMSEDAVLDTIIPRLSDEEINELVGYCNDILRRHLTKKEYHQLFLEES